MSYRYNSMQPVDGSTPIMPPFLLIRKTTNTPFASQDSVEMPAIRSPILHWIPVGYHGGMNFTTSDADNDRYTTGNCAQSCTKQDGGSTDCCHSCLTCQYGGSNFQWSYSNGWQTSGKLRAARMMIKSKWTNNGGSETLCNGLSRTFWSFNL